MVFRVYVPDFKPFANAPERIKTILGGVKMASVAVPRGMHTLSFELPKRLAKSDTIRATLTMATSYVPKDIGVNNDTRTLSIILVDVSYR